MLVNNGRYRRSIIVFQKFYDGVESFTGGFPYVENIRNSFAEYQSISLEEFQRMSATDYQNRLNAFYTYLGFKYSFFNPIENIPNIEDETINNEGIDSESCPIDLPNGSKLQLTLSISYRNDGADKFATIKAELRNSLGNSVTLPVNYFGTVIVKTVDGVPLTDWLDVEGVTEPFTLFSGETEVTLVSEFQYKGTGLLQSVEVFLMPNEEDEYIEIYPTNKVQITPSEPVFLLNHISNLQSSDQDIISNQIAQEKVNSGEGIRILGKKDYIFTFEPDQLKRPVFIYPKSWGKLSEILLVQMENLNIINDGAFLYDNGEPFEYSIEVNSELITYYVYASRAMVAYPYRVDYLFKF